MRFHLRILLPGGGDEHGPQGRYVEIRRVRMIERVGNFISGVQSKKPRLYLTVMTQSLLMRQETIADRIVVERVIVDDALPFMFL
ncbi:hypothetical protein ATDW_23720 [Asticcacaulis sp. DW145]|uniref:hypothetical protein n=1 Tax=Asticcacaulis sp. DW145 TaxID=3095608 RepID=UPI0030899C34|nr:hypothetical protein ATDW_23720 [Asticcacaulis sp. DW145]